MSRAIGISCRAGAVRETALPDVRSAGEPRPTSAVGMPTESSPIVPAESRHDVHRLKSPMVGIEAEYGWGNPEVGASPTSPPITKPSDGLARQDLIERGLKRLAFCGIPGDELTGWSRAAPVGVRAAVRTRPACPAPSFTRTLSRRRDAAKLHNELSAWLQSLRKTGGTDGLL